MLASSKLQGLADTLLSEGLLLTALELHVELAEKGQCLSSLKEFFEDSANFDKFLKKPLDIPPSPCPSSGSLEIQRAKRRADSQLSLLEAARLSEDSHAQTDDKLAVLEFELRKARETINTLRTELTTQATKAKERHLSSDTIGNENHVKDLTNLDSLEELDLEDKEDEPEMQAHEQRMLNYLVNEYLLQHGYKLTAITFSDENTDEDFEDWDSIGLNMSKPPSLLLLLRDFGQRNEAKARVFDVLSNGCQVDMDSSIILELEGEIKKLLIQIEKQDTELITANCLIDEYKLKVSNLESSLQQMEQQAKRENTITEEPTENLVPIRKDPISTPTSVSSALRNFVIQNAAIDINEAMVIMNDCHLLTVLEQCIPKIVPNVILAKRDELIPLLVATINQHTDAKVRDGLLNLLFNLIKRPDRSQRQMILRGFRKMAFFFGSARIEAELLPQCWEQIDHKYEERRLLVAETCAILVPFVNENLRCSLLLSILLQMAVEDKCPEVRVAAIDSLAILVLYLQDGGEKFESLWQTNLVLLKDRDPRVVSRCQQSILLSVSSLGLRLGKMESVIMTDVMNELHQMCEVSEDAESLVKLKGCISTLECLYPYVIMSVIKLCPQLIPNDYPLFTSDNSEVMLHKTFGFETLAGDSELAQRMVTDLQEVLSREWYETWPQLQWVSNFFFKRLVDSISCIQVGAESLISDLVALVSKIPLFFGKIFIEKHFTPLFNDKLYAEGCQSTLKAVFILGVVQEITYPGETCQILSQWVPKEKDLSYVIEIADNLANNPIYVAALSDMAWRYVVSDQGTKKCFASELLSMLAAKSGGDSIDSLQSKILPGLVTLSSDQDETVRVSAMPGIAQIVMRSTGSTQEKACLQFMSYFELESSSHEVSLRSFDVVTRCWKDLPAKFREEVLLPKMTQVYSSHGRSESEVNRTEMVTTSLQMLQSLSSTPLSVQTVQTSVNSLMKMLHQDVKLLVPGYCEEMEQLIKHFESAYGTLGADKPTNESPGISRLAQSPSIDEMKQKMSKFLKPSNAAQFWKK